MDFESFFAEVNEPQKLTEGWRGVVFSGFYKGNKVAIKKSRDKKFDHCIKNEIENVKKLAGFPSIPKLYATGEDFFAVEFIEGNRLDKYIECLKVQQKSGEIAEIILKTINSLLFFDKNGFFKKELKRCTNNVLVNANKDIYFIDFEKSRFGVYNKNIPQFLQFLKYIDIFDFEKASNLGKLYSATFDIDIIRESIKKAIV